MSKPIATIDINATPNQVWQTLTDLRRLPEWYVPSQWIKVLTEGPVSEGWQFVGGVRTLAGLELEAVGTIKEFSAETRRIVWHGKALGIEGLSEWQITPIENGRAQLEHSFWGHGWLYFLSAKTGRNQFIMQQRLNNLKQLVEAEDV